MKTTFILIVINLAGRELNYMSSILPTESYNPDSPQLDIIAAVLRDNNPNLSDKDFDEEYENTLDEDLVLSYIDNTTGHLVPLYIS